MSIANQIIQGSMPDFPAFIASGGSLEDIDEYGFTPLIESVIARQPDITKALLNHGVDVNARDLLGRSALHWAVDNQDLGLTKLLLKKGANPNAYTSSGLSILVYPILRDDIAIKHMLYRYDAKINFALDFINGKLLGHRYALTGGVDIVNADNEFVPLDYEGFMLEFSVEIINSSLRRFSSSFATRHLRSYFPTTHTIMDALDVATQFLKFQLMPRLTPEQKKIIDAHAKSDFLILPVASSGHALCFIYYYDVVNNTYWWVKIDRGANAKVEGSVNIYYLTEPDRFSTQFLLDFLYKMQSLDYFHEGVNHQLGLKKYLTIPMSAQISGNCSFANVQAVMPIAYALLNISDKKVIPIEQAMVLYDAWITWDADRALDECIQRFYLADSLRKHSLASMLAAVLFQSCDYNNPLDLQRAEKILNILNLSDYRYILNNYLEIYCVEQLTRKGNNLLKILEDCGVDSGISINPIEKD